MYKKKESRQSIHKKLTQYYGGLTLTILLTFLIFSSVIIAQFKTRGIDDYIIYSLESAARHIEDLIHSSVKKHLAMENKRLILLGQDLLDLVEEEILSLDRAKQILIDDIMSSQSGDSGYSYAVDSRGIMVAHPIERFMNQDYSWDEGIQRQLTMKSGILEYDWQNPDEEKKRRKILYMDTLEPLGWVVSTTAYADEKEIADIKKEEMAAFLANEKIRGLDCIALLDGEGEFYIRTDHDGGDEASFISSLKLWINQIKSTKQGKLNILVEREGLGFSRDIIFYRYLEDLEWILIGTGHRLEMYGLLFYVTIILAVSLMLCLLLFVLLNRKISAQLTQPLQELIRTLDLNGGGDFSIRSDIKTGDEWEILSSHFNRFMESNQKIVDKISEARDEIKTLAQFPDENPNPVIRLDRTRNIEYANFSALRDLLEPLDLSVGHEFPADLYDTLMESKSMTGRKELEVGDRFFSFHISQIERSDLMYLYAIDITRQKRFETIQLLSENIFHNSIEGIVITDRDGCIESVNPAFTHITGYSEEEVTGQNPRILKSYRHDKTFYTEMWQQLLDKGYWNGEIWNRKKNGKIYAEYLTITSLRNEEGEISQFISFFHDLSDLKEKEERILYESTHDNLTGLPNREKLISTMNDHIQIAPVKNSGFSLIYMDIRKFKRINESLGPEAGDKLLLEITDRFRELFKSDSSLYRPGSDEFACLLFDKTEKEEILYTLEDIISLFHPPFLLGRHEIKLDIFMGVSVFPYDGTEPLSLISKSESAMNSAKSDVRKPYQFYSHSTQSTSFSRLELENWVRRALEEQRFYLNYQPKVSVEDGRILGSEALVRMEPFRGVYIGPDVFIPVAEEIGIIEPMGSWILEKACRDTRILHEKGFTSLNVAVNLSPFQFRNPELSNQVSNIVDATGLPFSHLNLEITEGMAIDNVQESIRMMRKLTNMGLTLSIDDFGTGYSSLSYLSNFPVDILKIDKAFVTDIPKDDKMTGVVKAILSMADHLGMKTVAEGVETIEHYDFLKANGCHQIQGYYFFKPLSFDDYSAVLEKERAPEA